MSRSAEDFARRDRAYFDLFEEAGQNIQRSADLLDALLAGYPDSRDLAQEIRACEHTGDRITHDIINRLNHTVVAPIDREDVLALAPALDDIVDYIEEVADYLGLYKIEAPMDQAIRLAAVLKSASRNVCEAIPLLRGFSDISHYTVEINRLENEADRVHQQAVSRLFDDERDPLIVMKWKETLDFLEDAIDRCEDVANVIEGVMVKHG